MLVNIGKGIELDVDVSRLAGLGNGQEIGGNAVLHHVIYIGLRNVLMDSHAGVTAEKSTDVEADSRAMAEKKLAAMYAGEVRSVGTRTGDPVKAEAIRIASKVLVTAAKKAGKVGKNAPDPKAVREAAITLIGRDATFTEQARKNVEANKAIESDTSDLIAGL